MRVVLDGRAIATEADLHRALADRLDFGPYYGHNRAALWDRLTTDVPGPLTLVWENADASRGALGKGTFDQFVQLFRDVEQFDRELGLPERFVFVLTGLDSSPHLLR